MYQEIVNVSISLETTAVSRQGFGTAIFVGAHNWFPERSRSYSSLVTAAEDLPTDSDEYIALQAAFAQDPKPSFVKVGRRETDSAIFTPEAVTAIGQTYSITVTEVGGATVTASFVTTTGSETPADVATALATALTGGLSTVTVTDNTGSFTLAENGAAYSISDIARLSYSFTVTESAADMITAIREENDDFYFIATSDHTSAFIQAMAAAVEATEKLYFVSTQDTGVLSAYSGSSTDIGAVLKNNSYLRTSCWYHHYADTLFPEMAYVEVAAPADPGKKIWANNRVYGYEAARQSATGNFLTTTQKDNLVARYMNFTEVVGGITITRRGQVSGNEWIDVIRNRDFLKARLTEAYQTYMINRPVIPYTNAGINSIASVLSSTLNRYVETETAPNILQADNPFVINFPRRSEVSFGDVAARTFSGSFTAYLSGAIQVITISGVLTYDAQA